MPSCPTLTCAAEVAYVVAATWVAKEDAEAQVADIIETLTPLCRAEPGCLMYQAHRSPEDSRLFFIYEQYADEEAFEAHRQSEHFQRWVLEEAAPLLESREREFYITIEDQR